MTGVVEIVLVDGSEVDLGGEQRLMTEALANHGQGDAVPQGVGGPGVTGDIHRETGREPHQLRETMEGVVHPLLGTEELVAVALAVEDREEIARGLVTGCLKLRISPERVDELLHAGFPTDGERGA